MNTLLSYIIRSFIASGVLYLYYQLALKNKKFHCYNRFYLLLSIVISLAIPLMNFSWLRISTEQNRPLTDLVNSINAPVAGQPIKFFIPGPALFGISAFASMLLLISLAWQHVSAGLPSYGMILILLGSALAAAGGLWSRVR